jgi:hypothetical protein
LVAVGGCRVLVAVTIGAVVGVDVFAGLSVGFVVFVGVASGFGADVFVGALVEVLIGCTTFVAVGRCCASLVGVFVGFGGCTEVLVTAGWLVVVRVGGGALFVAVGELGRGASVGGTLVLVGAAALVDTCVEVRVGAPPAIARAVGVSVGGISKGLSGVGNGAFSTGGTNGSSAVGAIPTITGVEVPSSARLVAVARSAAWAAGTSGAMPGSGMSIFQGA